MAMGTRKRRERQQEFWIPTNTVVEPPGNAFYDQLNRILGEHKFDQRVEALCRKFYKKSPYGRPSITPGMYFRCLMIGYFEGLDSERGIAWRIADSLSLRKFLGYALDEETPDHSTISRTRRLYWLETHKAIFRWVIRILTGEGLINGKTISIDATTLEANAAMKSIVRRDNEQSYNDYLKDLARAAGIENPTREQLARLDRKRKKKGSNEEWKSPADPDARITKMKDGRTHLAHKAEHAVDLSSGALVAVTLQPGSEGDTSTMQKTLAEAQSAVSEIRANGVEELVADKGYHSGPVLTNLHDEGVRTYIPEPDRGGRNWDGKEEERQRTYENRRRVRGNRGKRLQKIRSELTERSFAHMYETGGMRRVHLRGRDNILKRLLVQGAAFNLSLILRKALGAGKPRQLQGLCGELFALCGRVASDLKTILEALDRISGSPVHFVVQSSLLSTPFLRNPPPAPSYLDFSSSPKIATIATGC
ncbi:MAG TPA: transposase [Candidatus Acidoferrum sp.]|jgi:transposase|nr:transposase [Candidatus Acidoferrum sp.]